MSKLLCKNYLDGTFRLYKFVQVKRDGIYVRVQDGRAYTSQDTDITRQCLHNGSWLGALYGKMQTYGELYAPGKPASEVKSYLATGRSAELKFEVFASCAFAADASLRDVSDWCRRTGVAFVPFYETSSFAHLQECWDHLHTCYAPDIEGLVFKQANLLGWHKWKPVRTVDLICTGFIPGQGKYAGLIGALRGATVRGNFYIERATVGGMDDAERVRITAHADAYIGCVFECAYQYVGSQGRLRHPRFVMWRDDKVASECTEEQLTGGYDT